MHFVYCQNMYFNGLNSGAKFYFHSFNTLKIVFQNMAKFIPNVIEKM